MNETLMNALLFKSTLLQITLKIIWYKNNIIADV